MKETTTLSIDGLQMEFETFSGSSSASVDPTIAINVAKSGSVAMTFNKSFCASVSDDFSQYTHVKLMYSKDNSVIALDFTNDSDGAIKISGNSATKRTPSIAISSFAKTYKLDKGLIKGLYSPNSVIVRDKKLWIIKLNG